MYKDVMYPAMKDESIEYYVKPMNCPHTHVMYPKLVTSYRDLPLRLAEDGTVYRYEQSGVASGMMRVRGMTTNDAHIYVTPEQLEQEFINVLKLFKEVYEVMGISDFWYRLSLPDFEKNPDKYGGEKKLWEGASESIRKAMQKFGARFEEAKGEAAFYGPKIDVQIKNIYGKEESIATAQVDILVPQRLGLGYTDEHNQKKTPIVIHRAILGSYERFLAHLIEHFEGKFPLWLSPTHVIILPLSDKFNKYAAEVESQLRKNNIRVKLDDRQESLNKKVRGAQLDLIPYILVVGEKEQQNKSVAVRTRDGKVHGEVKTDEFIDSILNEIKSRK